MNNIQFDDNMINHILKHDVVMFDDLDNYWVIWTNKGILAPKNGRMLHETREQALRHWYNSLRWRTVNSYRHEYAKVNHPGVDYWKVKIPYDAGDIWKAFKSEIAEKYDFQIIQWKYVKDKLRE